MGTERKAKIEALRKQRLEEKLARQKAREEAVAAEEAARLEAAAAAERARIEAEHLTDAQKRAERKERKKAIKEAKRYGAVNVVASSEDKNFSYAPTQDQWKLDPNAAYVHYTPNETIGGVEIFWTPQTGSIPLVADMSSTILSRPIDVSKFGLIYAGAQKNIGPAGLTIVIVRDDLIGETLKGTPTMFDYKIHADNDSMYNTPATFAMYTAGLVFKWLKVRGGLAAMEKTNREKAGLLYDYLDATDFYNSPVAKDNRSLMNVPFTLKDAALDEAFLKAAKERGLIQLKGHRSVGGMRASIYNAMPIEGVQALADFMRDFERRNG